MDVRCSKCGVEYEFDDAKVTASGVTVKCTSCGHVFKVKREEPASVPPSPSTSFGAKQDGEWMVRTQQGTVYRFKELTTLQKWIVERKVSRDDEISKTGKSWKKLGEIAELTSFFQVVDAASAALQMAQAPPAQQGPNPFVIVPTNTALPALHVPPQSPIATTQPVTQPPITQPITQPVSMPPTSIPPMPMPPPSVPPQPARIADPTPSPPTAPSVPVPRAMEPAPVAIDALDDDDPVLEWQKKKQRRLMAAALLLSVGALAAVGVVFRDDIQKALGAGPPPGVATAVVDEARAALRSDRRDAIEAVVSKLGEATPDALAWNARLKAALASHDREQQRLHTQLATLIAADAAKHQSAAQAAGQRADEELGRVYQTVSAVRAQAPALADGHLAAAAYQLEKGGYAEHRADLEAARKAVAGADNSAVDAEIAVQAALADARAALNTEPQAALERLPQSDDGRLQYTKAALSVAALAKKPTPSEVDLAPVKALVAAMPRPDARADLLAQVVDALTPKAAPEPVAADAGVAAVAPDAGAEADSVDDKKDTYEVVMQKAERARVNERSKTAHELFTKAAKMKPGAPRPWLGLGWSALDLGKYSVSIKAFNKALDLDESLAEAHLGLAEAYRYSGNKAKALDSYQTYLKINPTGKDAEVARRAIDTLKE